MWNLKNDTNEPIYETETDSQTQRTELWSPGVWGWTGSLGLVDANYYIQNIKQINNKVLQYSTGNYIQSPGINHNGKEYFKMYIFV